MDEIKMFYKSGNDKLCGLLSMVNDNKKIFVMCHGLNSTKEESGSFTVLSHFLNEKGINTYRFDFTGHGESSGKGIDMTIEKEKMNLKSTLEMLISKGFESIVVLGASFGGGIVCLTDYTKYDQVKAMLLWYPALTYRNGLVFNEEQYQLALQQGYYLFKSNRSERQLQVSPTVFEETLGLYPYKNLYIFNKPILILHGDKDKITPIDFSKKVAEDEGLTNCNLEVIKGGEHGFPVENSEVLNEAIVSSYKFIEKYL